jgi:uracil-DNA glycosylase
MPKFEIEPHWKAQLEQEVEKSSFLELSNFVKQRYQTTTVFPAPQNIFNAFNITPFDQVKVVILGQDPYHGAGQAHGLCFSVQEPVPPPPSLQNIFKEICNDLGVSPFPSGDLTRWAKQGVFLLNAILTVEQGQPLSHQSRGWEHFTDAAIARLNSEREHLVFLLWGAHAQKKGAQIDANKHLILQTVHPSPLSAHRGFLGCKHFSQTNAYLEQHGQAPIDWR